MAQDIININQIDALQYQYQTFDGDVSYVQQSNQTGIDFTLNPNNYVELYVYNSQNVLVNQVSPFIDYNIVGIEVVVDPQKDLEDLGYSEGKYVAYYNFLTPLLGDSTNPLYISSISSDRTEIILKQLDPLNNTITSDAPLQQATNDDSYFYLNFGSNNLLIGVNSLYNNNTADPAIAIKLYKPLPAGFSVNNTCWVVDNVASPIAYSVEIQSVFTPEETVFNRIAGPNFNIDIQNQINNSTSYLNKNILTQNTSLLGSGSIYYQLNSILAEKGIEINVDYSNYANFIHFSSAQTRLENFYYKLSLIETYTSNATLASASINNNYYVSSSYNIWQTKINEIITNFDGYEYYLYYESSSTAWPKTNNSIPYINASTTSPSALGWFATQSVYALEYDQNINKDALILDIPEYLREDDNNTKYLLFTQMVGQHFDNVWLYIKDITNKFDADNRLEYGISKDIVAQAIRDLGVKLYQNNFSDADVYSALLGITPSGSTLLIPNATSSLPVPSGSGLEYVNTYVTASATGSILPLDSVNKEIYKRIYHNLPILLKKKGTPEGLRLLINLYGIPDTILRINEFGGKLKAASSWDNFQDTFNYSFDVYGNGYVKTTYTASSAGVDPKTVAFRFSTYGVPSTSSYQTLLKTDNYSIVLDYTASGLSSGSYSGSIVNPYDYYGMLKFINTVSGSSASVYLPFFDNGWWSTMLVMSGSTQTLYAKNNIYSNYDGNTIGFQASSSVTGSLGVATGSLYLSNSGSQTISGRTYLPFSGSFQELRMYTTYLSESSFNDYVMNPYSIKGNTLTGPESAFNTLIFRAPLGTVLDNSASLTTRTSIHPSITQYPVTQSFVTGNSTYYLSGSFSFVSNEETIYQDQPIAGIKNAITEKIQISPTNEPSGSVLSQYITIQQNSYSEVYTPDVDYVEVAFSPQDEVNDDIISQLGYFNIGNYIGDPRQMLDTIPNYPDLDVLRDEYFSKYTHNYNLWDYIRLIKFYDNSLFKMIKDFVPARTSLATGIVIKPTLLERRKYPQPRVNTNSVVAYVGDPLAKINNIPN
jgi:hypothetical protein